MHYALATMPSVKIEKQSKLSADDSFQRISSLLSNDKDLKKLDPKYQAKFDQQTRSGSADGSMFKAKMNVKDSNPGSTVEITVDLPMAMFPFKGMIEKTLSKKLEEALA